MFATLISPRHFFDRRKSADESRKEDDELQHGSPRVCFASSCVTVSLSARFTATAFTHGDELLIPNVLCHSPHRSLRPTFA